MKERPILFSAPMVRAILAGRKTQTRRIVKPQPSPEFDPTVEFYHRALIDKDGEHFPDPVLRYGAADENEDVPSPYGCPGDRLWVKECFAPCRERENHADAKAGFTYRADWDACDEESRDFRWKPSIFCTRAASRITLEIESVRVERLDAITEADAIAEGVTKGPLTNRWAYRELWEDINGPGSWTANPWVWVIGFRRVTP